MIDHSSSARRFSVVSRWPLAVVGSVVLLTSSYASAAPAIQTVHGCPSDAGKGTTECSTLGGTHITIVGDNFGASGSSAFVGGRDCAVTTQSNTQLECTLPEGSGDHVDVVVTDDTGASSIPARFLSYSPPAITSVSGCIDDGAGNTSSCARDGSQHITIQGTNFGPPGDAKSVVTGGVTCPVQSDSDSQIVCTLPPGSGPGQRVLVIAANQLSPGAAYTFSYSQCDPGEYISGSGQCSSCDAGYFSSGPDSRKCEKCPDGAVISSDKTSCTGTSSLQCYQVKDQSATKFTPATKQYVDDFSSNGSAELKKPALLCTAADFSAGGVTPPKICQCCYGEKGSKLPAPVSVSTDDTISSRTLDVTQPKMACVSCSCDHL